MPKVNKEKLTAIGISAALAYGWVSNVNMSLCVILSWVTFGKSCGLSPLDQGQWPSFLAVYAGFWLACNFLRPFRIALAVAVSPAFDKLIHFLESRLGISQQKATFLLIFLVNVVGTLTLLFGGLFVATRLTGTALLPTKGRLMLP
ncbi:hypothetical protein GUITHDRAFT_63464 [Guillardia theta CCMP2712]|uniref:Uncharacterized protein n=1 Tax=Guillardia theta (strain CCMP2712) TaxID=905079 RepID=L1K1B3_GUITC|nr:hypothetical protein GUITHDRAFT_63464 [Guillardia theta CCMP2712]EKX54334.1 hypothetical protein GUITHDRAFT_63464 [Guillardia theta CCMP2712]|eukprot:XP_005841314.1 hypothetical protein GUITHDRAFT_63464 [Guillardia theta CCMP2712]